MMTAGPGPGVSDVLVLFEASGPAAAAASSSLSQSIADVVGQSGAPLTPLQTHFIQNMIHETLEEFRLV